MNDREILDDFDEFDELLTNKESDVNIGTDGKETDEINEEERNKSLDNFENSINNNIEDHQIIEKFDDIVEENSKGNYSIKTMEIPSEENNHNLKKEELENPIVEMVNNKTTMKLIIVMLVVLFIAVMFMPTIINFIKDLIK